MATGENANTATERFPASGRITGWLVVATGAVMVGTGLYDFDKSTDLITAVGLLIAIAGWVGLLRPAVWADQINLVLRGSFTTTRVPLAGIESVALGKYLEVRAGAHTFTNMSMSGKSGSWERPTAARDARNRATNASPVTAHDLVMGKLHGAINGGRLRAKVTQDSNEQYELGQQSIREVDSLPATLVCVGVLALLLALLIN